MTLVVIVCSLNVIIDTFPYCFYVNIFIHFLNNREHKNINILLVISLFILKK